MSDKKAQDKREIMNVKGLTLIVSWELPGMTTLEFLGASFCHCLGVMGTVSHSTAPGAASGSDNGVDLGRYKNIVFSLEYC
jgi:hypothetical protein